MTIGWIPYLRYSKRNRKRGTNVDPFPGPSAKLQRLRLCQDNEATESQRAIDLGIGTQKSDPGEQIDAYRNVLGSVYHLLGFWSL
jgi:hypothetical protein